MNFVRKGMLTHVGLVVSRFFAHFELSGAPGGVRSFCTGLAAPAMAQAVMAPLIWRSFSSSMFKFLLVDQTGSFLVWEGVCQEA
jgi:hypothetical protein